MRAGATPSNRPASRTAPPGGARRAGAAALALAAGLALAAPAVRAAPGGIEVDLPRVRRVRVEGTRVLDAGDLRKVLKTQGRPRLAFWAKGAFFRQDFLTADVAIARQFAAQRGFLDATVTARTVAEPGSNQVDVVFVVSEGVRTHVGSLALTPPTVYREAELREKLATRPGRPFNPRNLSLDRQTLADAYADRGHFPAIAAEWTRTDSATVAVEFRIAEGREYSVGAVAIEGLTAVDTSVVRRELAVAPGRTFRRTTLVKSSERLYETQLFQLVDLEPTRVDTVAGVVDLRVRVRERPHRWVQGGVGAGSLDGLRLSGEVGHGNLWGVGRRAEAQTRIAFGGLERFSNRLRFVEPWLFGTRAQGEVGGYFQQGDEYFKGATFSQRVWGFYFSARRRLSPFTEATLGLDNQWSRPMTTPGLPDSQLTSFPEQQLFTQRLSLVLHYDRRDDILDPRQGEYYELAAVSAGRLLAGEGQFNKATTTGIWHRRLRGGASFGVRAQAGGIWAFGGPGTSPLENVPIQDLYLTGGAYSVRGYPELSINGADGSGGVVLLVTNAELRFPLYGLLAGAVFLDGGNVWSRATDLKIGQLGLGSGPGDGNDYRWSVGTGVRLRTPVGPFRADVGLRLRSYAEAPTGAVRSEGLGYHLSIGQPF